MREIKFRGKAKSNGQWVYGNLSYREADDGYSCVYIEDQGWGGGLTEVDPKSVGQYTGLKDADGKEIYEGDILYYRSTCGCEKRNVVFRDAAFFLERMNGYSLGLASSFTEYMDGPLGYNSKEKLYLHIVIGNIHDKKE